jgi:glycosyltransferase involved in cell wall biosynthesis
MRPRPEVHVVVPHGVDDPLHPSGGNTYDRRAFQGLHRNGWRVHEHHVAGTWPQPDPWARAALTAVLDAIPCGSVVLVDGLVGCAAPDVLVRQADRLRVVVLLHLPLGVVDAEHRPGEKAVLAAAAGIVVPSRWASAWVLDEYGLPPDLVHLVPPGVDAARATVAEGDGGRFVCVGAVTPLKGHDVLVDALATLPDLPWQCSCVGALDVDTDFARALRGHVADTGMAGRVIFCGPLVGTRLEEAYGAADLLLLPSRREAYGMVVTEALARAVPVVAADVGGVREALGADSLGNVPGLLFAPGDADGLADALRSWLTDPELRGSLRQRALSRRATLTGWAESAARLADVVDRVLAGGRRARG